MSCKVNVCFLYIQLYIYFKIPSEKGGRPAHEAANKMGLRPTSWETLLYVVQWNISLPNACESLWNSKVTVCCWLMFMCHVLISFQCRVLQGAGKLLRDSRKHPAQLRSEVCTPGGTTIYGLHTLEQGGLRAATMSAVESATERARELGRKSGARMMKWQRFLSMWDHFHALD